MEPPRRRTWYCAISIDQSRITDVCLKKLESSYDIVPSEVKIRMIAWSIIISMDIIRQS